MPKTHKFVVNTENVNSYGYRILTDGIDFEQYLNNPVVLYMHNRGFSQPKGNEVIGKCVKLYKEDGKLIAEIQLDENEPFAKAISEKIDGGFINMTSLGADILETSSAPDLALQGQKYETVTKCKMVEISIVDIGGNDDALKLHNAAGKPVELKLLQTNNNTMSEFKTIALALGKPADTSEEELLKTVNELKLAKDNADAKTQEWKDKYIALQKTEATKLVDKAVSLGLIPEDLKDVQITAFESDFAGQSAKLSKLITDKENQNSKNGVQGAINSAVNLAKGAAGKTAIGDGQDSFDYLQKHNAVELSRIRSEEPQKYAELVKDYASGVRYTAK